MRYKPEGAGARDEMDERKVLKETWGIKTSVGGVFRPKAQPGEFKEKGEKLGKCGTIKGDTVEEVLMPSRAGPSSLCRPPFV